jgi:DNA-binding NarL/FixJ family response regulator
MLGIVLVDDHPVVRIGVRALVDEQPDMTVVGEAGSAPEAVAVVAECSPGLVIQELVLDGTPSGAELCWALKQRPAPPSVLVLTSRREPGDLTAGYLAGADSYVHKAVGTASLLSTIRATAAGRRVWACGAEPARVDGDVAHGHLTPREREVLALLLQHCSNAEIGVELHLGLPTVKTHVSAVLRKLGRSRRHDLFLPADLT